VSWDQAETKATITSYIFRHSTHFITRSWQVDELTDRPNSTARSHRRESVLGITCSSWLTCQRALQQLSRYQHSSVASHMTLRLAGHWARGATTAEKLRGTKAGLGVGCGRGSPPPAVKVWGYHPRKIFEHLDTKSYILVTTCCKFSCFF